MARTARFTAALSEATIGRDLLIYDAERLVVTVTDLPPGAVASFTVAETAGADPLIQVDGTTTLVIGPRASGTTPSTPATDLGPLSEGVTYRYNLWRINADGDRDLMAYGQLAVALSIRPVLSIVAPGTATADSLSITADSSLITADAA